VAGGWRRLHKEELHYLYASPNVIKVIKLRRIKWAGHVACMEEMRNVYKIFIVKHEWKRSHRRPRCRWEDNIRIALREIG